MAILRKPYYALVRKFHANPVDRADATKDPAPRGDRIHAQSQIRYTLIDIAIYSCGRKK
jgi:hypothetical protein